MAPSGAEGVKNVRKCYGQAVSYADSCRQKVEATQRELDRLKAQMESISTAMEARQEELRRAEMFRAKCYEDFKKSEGEEIPDSPNVDAALKPV
eukprot:10447110-Alexandrium_andersonii.AAC.1